MLRLLCCAIFFSGETLRHKTNSTNPLICLPNTPQGQAELLKHARNEVQENLKQIHYAALTCNLSKRGPTGGSSGSDSKSRRSLEAISEKATGENKLCHEDN